jgi:hypothetical protein
MKGLLLKMSGSRLNSTPFILPPSSFRLVLSLISLLRKIRM